MVWIEMGTRKLMKGNGEKGNDEKGNGEKRNDDNCPATT